MKRTDYYYMNDDERRLYHRKKENECRERKAILRGRPIRHKDPDSHPSQMTYEERLSYNRDALRRHKERQKYERRTIHTTAS